MYVFDESLSRLYQQKSQNKQKDKYQLLLFQRDVCVCSLFCTIIHNKEETTCRQSDIRLLLM